MLNNIINSKKLASEYLKVLYKGLKKSDYDNIYELSIQSDEHFKYVMIDGYAIYKTFKDEFFIESKSGNSTKGIKKLFDDIDRGENYKLADTVEKVIKSLDGKETTLYKLTRDYTTVYVDSDLLKFFDNKKVHYEFYIKTRKTPIRVGYEGETYGIICPIYIEED